MRYDACQFGSFDGLDNRKTVMDLFRRMGRGMTDDEAGMARAGFLQGLLSRSQNGFALAKATVEPCTAAEAYHQFVAITGVLGVPIVEAAKLLEDVVRHMGVKA